MKPVFAALLLLASALAGADRALAQGESKPRPTSGVVIWKHVLDKKTSVTIKGNKPDPGKLEGEFPEGLYYTVDVDVSGSENLKEINLQIGAEAIESKDDKGEPVRKLVKVINMDVTPSISGKMVSVKLKWKDTRKIE